jgi:hypothetical protein
MAEQQLMDYFKFDEADLIANQSGQITEKQKASIIKKDKAHLSLSSLFSSKFGYKLATLQGPINIDSMQTSYHGGNLWYYLEVREKSFRVDENLANIMKQGDVYTIHYCYAEHTPEDNGLYKILSVEFISRAK